MGWGKADIELLVEAEVGSLNGMANGYRGRGTLKSHLRGKVQLTEGIKFRQID